MYFSVLHLRATQRVFPVKLDALLAGKYGVIAGINLPAFEM